MERVLYIDILFLATGSMNTFLLWAAGRLAGFRAKKWRILLGGILSAGLYCGQIYFFGGRGGFFSSLLLLTAAFAAAYLPKRLRLFLRLLGCGIFVSFLMGGGMQFFFTWTQSYFGFGKSWMLRQVYPWWLLPWSILLAYLFLKWGARWMEAHIQRRREYCTVRVLWRGRCAEGRVLIDTGNGLRQGDGRGVAILEIDALLPLFTPEEQLSFLSGRRDELGLEVLSFSSLGNPGGKLWGIRAEKLLLFFGEKRVVHRKIFVGIAQEPFGGSYEGLVPPCLLEEGME